ncbi:MAG: ABC transporter permease [Planctomycetota bacterium]
MYRLFLALRYFWSRPFAWVAMIGIWLTVAALICTVAIMSGFLQKMQVMIRGTTSDIILTPMTMGSGIEPPSLPLIEWALEGMDDIVAISPHVLRPALLAKDGATPDIARLTPDETDVTQVIGIDLERELRTTSFGTDLLENLSAEHAVDDPTRPFAWDAKGGEPLPVAVVGEGLLEKHELKKGDVITLVTLPENITMERVSTRAQKFRVAGSLRSGHFHQDLSSVFVTLDVAREFAMTGENATEICVRAKPGTDLDLLADEMVQQFKLRRLDVIVETWRDRNENYLASVDNQRSILGFLLFFFVIVACFNIFATLTILVSDKTRDIGVLGALGASSAGIAGLFVTCAGIITVIGAAAGCVSGVIVARNINHVNDGVEALFGIRIFRPDIYLFDRIPTEIQGWFVGMVFGATLLIALLCALLPALRAARMDQIRALRHE